jgi:pyruvate,water dikinase
VDESKQIDHLIHDLRERAKELNCLYEVQELLNTPDVPIDTICESIIKVVPPGWQYPDVCQAEITLGKKKFRTARYRPTSWIQSADINVQDEKIGRISVWYTEERPISDEGPFLKEERKLINTIAEKVGFFILHERLRQVFQEREKTGKEQLSEWQVILDLLKRTDYELLMRISRKMIIFLGRMGIPEADRLLEQFSQQSHDTGIINNNQPFPLQAVDSISAITEEVFTIASQYFKQEVILDNIQKWSKEDRVNFLINTLANPSSTFIDISSAIERYHLLAERGLELTIHRKRWLLNSLIRRIMNSQPSFVSIAQSFLDIEDFSDLMHRIILPVSSHGKLGGKGSGLILAEKILKAAQNDRELLDEVKVPRTWYMTSDSVFYFLWYNTLQDFIDQEYKDINQVRQEYPYIMNVFKNSTFPPEIAKGFSLALDDFGDVPLIVRSSSLLEDQEGVAFAGKYKSLFVANKGSKEERLSALADAVSEVLASQFGPDPIEYRIEHNLIDHHEEIGVMIQEVVGTQIGHYYMPSFAGVAFSKNEFCWSSRIKPEDGLVRMVPGLGTRAVDRLSDDYPVLIAPGQPGLRVNISPEEIVRYSPKKMDVINLETCRFETIDVQMLLKEWGEEYPLSNLMVSIVEPDHIKKPSRLRMDFKSGNYIITFDGIFTNTPFLKQVQAILTSLSNTLGNPVDIEFAHDGKNFYLLQCRTQNQGEEKRPADIPDDLAIDNILFSANRYIRNGKVSGITHIVYVDPTKYAEIEQRHDLLAISRAIGQLNQILPRRHFILMGPGRWGSRGDVRLGVGVTYSDISNTAMLIEIARKREGYMPEPSFGTHFFQDLIETSISYLPLYPDEAGNIFNEDFLVNQPNVLPELLPNYAYLQEILRVIDITSCTSGGALEILMNAEKEKAVAIRYKPEEIFMNTG